MCESGRDLFEFGDIVPVLCLPLLDNVMPNLPEAKIHPLPPKEQFGHIDPRIVVFQGLNGLALHLWGRQIVRPVNNMAAVKELPVVGKPVAEESTATLYCGIKLAAQNRDENA